MDQAVSAIYMPRTIWAASIEQMKQDKKKSDTRQDGFVFIIGDKGSGKSTLLNRTLYPDKTVASSSSAIMDYTYARRSAQNDLEKKDLTHVWELPGHDIILNNLVDSEQVFMTPKQITTGAVIITVDLSNPIASIKKCRKYLIMVRKHVQKVFDKLEQRGNKVPEQLRLRAKKILFSGHPDRDTVQHIGINQVLVATKYDTFDNQEPQVKTLVAKALRHLAHSHGAHLVYSSGLAGDTATDKIQRTQQQQQLQSLRQLITHIMFNGIEKKISSKLQAKKDPLGPLLIPAGQDTFEDIGSMTTSTDIDRAMDDCINQVSKVMPETSTDTGNKPLDTSSKPFDTSFMYTDFAEQDIDALKQQKDKDLQDEKNDVKAREQTMRRQVSAARQKSVKQSGHSSRSKSAQRSSSQARAR